MRTSLYIALALSALSATVFAAPLPAELNNVLGSVTNPSAGDNNVFEGNGNQDGNGNGKENGNGNVVGNGNGKDNEAGNDNKSGNDNTFSFDGLSGLEKRVAVAGDMLESIDSTVGSVTHPSAGDENKFLGNGNGNGNGNGQGNGDDNKVGNGNGNGNEAGTGNSAGNGNSFIVSPETELPDVTLSPTIKSV
ncbi:hypothetical protein N0V83_009882 [Neocucurbitaria cava]|uniref:Uncharacterized protein n=1 Tax=Neocucurbitaria cava TaxID=798079 RepID=A0A9W8XZ68_9PLEO|nr:hypothetical protein N0V83_009882 [Neocucurbitaria cava]